MALCLAFRFVVLVWHRRAGKTVFACIRLVLAALRFKGDRGRFGYVSPYLRQSVENAWPYLIAFTQGIPGVVVNKGEHSITLPNGAVIKVYGADNPDSIRGAYFDGVVMDEVADMRPEVWGEIVRPMLLDRRGWALFIGTPKGINLFHRLYHAAANGRRKGWAADLRRAAETGMYSAEELADARRDMTENEWAQEMECDFGAAVADTLIALPLVIAAQGRILAKRIWNHAPRVIGVDCARYGDDESVIQPRQGLQAFKPRRFRGLDTMAVADQVIRFLETARGGGWPVDATFVDQGGLGSGVLDRLRQLGVPAVGVDFGGVANEPKYENKRAEMWISIRDWLKEGGALPSDEVYVSDLTAPKITYRNKRDKMQLESKDAMRARGLSSPDVGDALALTFAYPVAIRTEMDRLAGSGENNSWDYDPLAGA